MPATTIEAQGTATIYRRAERAVIDINIRSEGPKQDVVSENVTASSATLRTTLQELALKDNSGRPTDNAAVTHWSNASLSTGSYSPLDKDGNPKKNRIYTASTSFTVKFKDFSKLGEFASTLAKMEHVSINNIDWRLTDETKQTLIRELRSQAVMEACTKANDFVSAWSCSELYIENIKEGGMSGYQPQTYAYARQMRSTPGGGGDELKFEPEDVSMDCELTCVFRTPDNESSKITFPIRKA